MRTIPTLFKSLNSKPRGFIMRSPFSSPPSALLDHFRTALTSATSTSSSSAAAAFQIVHTIPTPSKPLPTPQTLHVLDSSFNPPTLAHQAIATSALSAPNIPSSQPKRLILLLATQNADKAPKPAAFEQRLAMMVVLAHDILAQVSSTNQEKEEKEAHAPALVVDVALTRHPFFVDKAAAIASHAPYLDPVTRMPPAQIHLLGFDSLVRLLDTKYYPPSHTLEPLEELFSRHRVRVTLRDDDKYGGREEQEKYVQALVEGAREGEGGKREWAERIELVAGGAEARGVSSTRVREVAVNGEWHRLEGLVSRKMEEWIEEQDLYRTTTASYSSTGYNGD